MTNADLIAEARKIHWHHPHRLAIDWACEGDCLQAQLADALEEAQSRIAELEAKLGRHPGYPFVEEQK